jgi:hypothetical protein
MESRKEKINELKPVYYISEATKTASKDRLRVRIRRPSGRRSREQTVCKTSGRSSDEDGGRK